VRVADLDADARAGMAAAGLWPSGLTPLLT
jgi:hypothetical protein